MNTYIVLLRGINVSGKNIIKMVDLRSLLVKLSFKNVITYIQSGNIILESNLTNLQEIEGIIQRGLDAKFGYDVNVLVLKTTELEHVFNNNPYIKTKDISRIGVTLLNDRPDLSHIEYLVARAAQNEDEFIVNDKCIYMYYPNGQGRSKLTHSMLEKKLNSKATSRNWKTITKLIELSNR